MRTGTEAVVRGAIEQGNNEEAFADVQKAEYMEAVSIDEHADITAAAVKVPSPSASASIENPVRKPSVAGPPSALKAIIDEETYPSKRNVFLEKNQPSNLPGQGVEFFTQEPERYKFSF